ncbi:MAG: class I SAM-dependent methyltransferase [Pyrinomonadaceae bacterium]
MRLTTLATTLRGQVLRRMKTLMRSGSNGQTPRPNQTVAFRGYTERLNEIRFVDPLNDDELEKLNNLLDWKCFVADSRGRRFGNAAWAGKRCEPQAVPDPRIILLHERFDLVDKHVLEVGCFEGIHTVGLSMFARQVTAVDARIENVVKTIVRCALFGYCPTIFKCDIETRPLAYEDLACDVLHHVGVLYHLKDPVSHLHDLQRFVRFGVMLDTHYAHQAEATESYEVDGRVYNYKRYREYGHDDPFSGTSDHSKWLQLDDLKALLAEAGFNEIEIVEKRDERNGPRVLLMARQKF